MGGIFKKLANVYVQNLNSATEVSQEIYHFLILRDLVILQIYLRSSQRRFKKQMLIWSENVRHRTSKFTKIG